MDNIYDERNKHWVGGGRHLDAGVGVWVVERGKGLYEEEGSEKYGD